MKKKTTLTAEKPIAAAKKPKVTRSATPAVVLELQPLPPDTLVKCIEPCIIKFQGLEGDTMSAVSGSIPVWKRLAMAFPQLACNKKVAGTTIGVTCDPRTAFEVLQFDPDPRAPYILARLKANAATMEQKDFGARVGTFGDSLSPVAKSNRVELFVSPPPTNSQEPFVWRW